VKLPRSVLYYGSDEALPELTALRSGPLSLVYEQGDLRNIRLGEREILRRVYVAIRDRNWGTVLPHLSNVQKEVSGEAFRISYEVENKQDEIDFFWKGTITGDPEGTITFAMEGVARSTFLRNRIGFCVLHPIKECAGQACTVEKADGSIVQGTFPRYIAPHQPFMDMRAIWHEVTPGVMAEVRFTGDTFEMEDQRNWTDASYKTYCTPLGLPFPVKVQAGTAISQSVSLTLKGLTSGANPEPASKTIILMAVGFPPCQLPRIGLGQASHAQPLTTNEAARLRALNPSHLRVDLQLFQPAYESRLRRAVLEASELRVPLEVALFLSDAGEDELRALGATLEQEKPALCRWLVFHRSEKSTTEKWIKLAKSHLAGYDTSAKIGGGTNAYFAELNRNRPALNDLDCATYSINPQVHAFDNISLIENLEGQASTLESARQFLDGRSIAISPVTLKPRFNPDATGPAPIPSPHELPPQVDVRQMSLFGAGWTLGSLKSLCESKYVYHADVGSITYYETTGWRGVMETESGSPLPSKFRSLPGSVFPLYHVLADVCEFAGGEVLLSTSGAPLKVTGLILAKGQRRRVVLGNLTTQPQVVRVTNTGLGRSVRVKSLDETTAEEAAESPESFRASRGTLTHTEGGWIEVRLRPYAVVRIDSA
jgi:D-apionolactonase